MNSKYARGLTLELFGACKRLHVTGHIGMIWVLMTESA